MFAAALDRKFVLSDYILWSTVASIFLQQRLFQAGVDVYLGYFVVVANSLLLYASGQLVLHRAQIAILATLSCVGCLAAIRSGVPLTSLIAQIVGITFMSTYFFSAVATQRNALYRLMDIYSACATLVALYGIVQYVAIKIVTLGALPLRLTSVFVEPALLVNATLPAVCYYFFRFVKDRSHKLELAIFMVTYILADSSLGFLGILIMIGLAFMNRLTFLRAVAGLLAVLLLAGGLFLASANLRLRVMGTFAAASTQNIDKSNQSTYALITNGYASYQSFLSHPLIGIGLGGHQFAYAKYVGDVAKLDNENYGQNITDANSMILRITSELGLFGLGGLCAFFIFFHRALGDKYRFLQRCFVPYFVVRLARDGHYFSLELYFFLAIYVMNFLESRIVAYPRPGIWRIGQNEIPAGR